MFLIKMERPDQDTTFTGTIMHETSQQILRHVLEPSFSTEKSFIEALKSPDKLIFSKAQNAYGACMDEEKLKALGSGPLVEVLRVIENIFPAVMPGRASGNPPLPLQHQKPLLVKRDTDDNLTNTVTYLEKIGVTALISFSISVCVLCCKRWFMWLIPATRPTIKIPTPLSSP